jgi:hypothetical protein
MPNKLTPFPRDPERFKNLAAPADGRIEWVDLKDWLDAWPDQAAVRALWLTTNGHSHREATKEEGIGADRLSHLIQALRTEFAGG